MTRFDQPMILVVEDDEPLSFMIARNLESEGYTVDTARDGLEGLAQVKQNKYNLVFVDIGLPRMNGMDLIKNLRSTGFSTPIIVITNQVSPEKEIGTFDLGSNLFHPKPINFDLLKAQVRSLLGVSGKRGPIKLGDLYLEPEKKLVMKAGTQIQLSKKEFDLLMLLINSQGDLLTRDQILSATHIGGYDQEEGSVDTLVSRTRKKLGEYRSESVIETVHGSGFRLNLAYFQN